MIMNKNNKKNAIMNKIIITIIKPFGATCFFEFDEAKLELKIEEYNNE